MAIYGKSKKKSNVVSQKSQFWVFTSMASPAEVLHAERGHQLPAAIGMLSLLCTVNMYTIYIYLYMMCMCLKKLEKMEKVKSYLLK